MGDFAPALGEFTHLGEKTHHSHAKRSASRGTGNASNDPMGLMRDERGFTLLELMTVVAIVGILSTLGLAQYELYVAKAKRVEAFAGLRGIFDAERTYFTSNTHYTDSFDRLGFSMEGGQRLSSTQIRGNRYTFTLSQPWGRSSFYCIANGQIDGDRFVDGVEIFDGRP